MQGKSIGIILIIVGVLMIAYTGFNFVTNEKVVDVGPIQINKEKNHFVQWPPAVGILLILGGVLVIARTKKALI
jgi:drug/metabolite transporter (DMT)-like permease